MSNFEKDLFEEAKIKTPDKRFKELPGGKIRKDSSKFLSGGRSEAEKVDLAEEAKIKAKRRSFGTHTVDSVNSDLGIIKEEELD